jgi:hypothetical protein
MNSSNLIRSFFVGAASWSTLFIGSPLLAQGNGVVRQTPSARIHVQNQDTPPVSVEVNGERIKGDGRLRYVGSLGNRDTDPSGVRWTFVCDPNPTGGASMEGRFDVVGPFDGWVMIEMPLNPVIEGAAALQLGGSLRASTDHPGVVLTIGRDDHALRFLVDDRTVDEYGRGPFTMQRELAGATTPKSWSTGEKDDRRDPIIVARCRDRLAIRASCRIDAGVEAMFTARIRLVGAPGDFRYRETVLETDAGMIPRSEDEISISVTGVGKGRSARSRKGARPNKPSAVVRQVVPEAVEAPEKKSDSAVEE